MKERKMLSISNFIVYNLNFVVKLFNPSIFKLCICWLRKFCFISFIYSKSNIFGGFHLWTYRIPGNRSDSTSNVFFPFQVPLPWLRSAAERWPFSTREFRSLFPLRASPSGSSLGPQKTLPHLTSFLRTLLTLFLRTPTKFVQVL
jgi:hypothetical protein